LYAQALVNPCDDGVGAISDVLGNSSQQHAIAIEKTRTQ
jgi:hypothetical protein